MRKLNNKGFAISTLIYGLAIMGIMIVAILMATMAQTRSNTTNLVKSIEQELNRFSRTETTFKPIGDTMISQEYVVPASGWYRIELWGTQGGGNGGRGAYTGGVIELVEGDILYFYVGAHKSGGGGYATEVRVRSGDYEDDLSYETSIMIAAGGGTDSTALGGTLYGYDDKMNSYGGFIDSGAGNKTYELLGKTATGNNTNGTLIGYNKNYALSNATNPRANVNVPSPSGKNGGGDGYFPSETSKAGGSSFIAGYAGNKGIIKGKTSNNAKLEYYEHVYVEEDTEVITSYKTTKTGDYYFLDGIMLPGVKTGDGLAKIERVKEKDSSTTVLKRLNENLDNIRYIKDCTAVATSSTTIYAVAKGVTYGGTVTNSNLCKIIDLGEIINADEVAVFHDNSGVDYVDNSISVSDVNSGGWRDIKKVGLVAHLSETETPTGYRVSAYQHDITETIPVRGNYIIMPVLSENKVLTASETLEENANPITIDYYKGENRQIWSIELITDTKINENYNENDPSTYEYKITELARFKALSITQDENIAGNTLSAIDKFNEKARNEPQIWKITPASNGTYIISTVMPGNGTGELVVQTNQTVSDALNQVIIGKNTRETGRFKLIQIDYSGS